MKKVIILHGTMGSPESNWFPWLQKKLHDYGYEVAVPKLPTPDGQSLESWLNILNEHLDDIKNGAILIGHSMGATCVLRFLENADFNINSVYLVSPVIDFIELEGQPEISTLFNKLNSSFVEKEFDWDKIKANSKHINIYYGDDDPYVPEIHAKTVYNHLGGNLFPITNGGHLNSEFGYDKFEKLLYDIVGRS